MITPNQVVEICSYLGAGLAVGISSVMSGVGTGIIAANANTALMKHPRAYDKLFSTMLIGQAACGTGGIFALVIGLLLVFGGFDAGTVHIHRAAAMLAAGLAIGLGTTGPSIGSGYSGGMACRSVGRMPRESNLLLGNMLVGQALSQSSAIFSLVVALLLVFSIPATIPNPTTGVLIMKFIAYIGAGLSIGLGTLGPGTGIGFVAGKASDGIGRFPRERASIIRTMFLGAAVSESTAIYSLVVAFLLIFAV